MEEWDRRRVEERACVRVKKREKDGEEEGEVAE